jgi:hypothetical protein
VQGASQFSPTLYTSLIRKTPVGTIAFFDLETSTFCKEAAGLDGPMRKLGYRSVLPFSVFMAL